ncbi:Scd6-like Sm domain-containing protein [Cercophora scortea]|uniref:Scd6-like Sm domain-containing protein n=1 Tax=Cercophora scortea TaxID=314031 RepID=A0AAE0I993_9PEZI|nr:Scd6-like Sm domain-containing protein [Cercophora scortea]
MSEFLGARISLISRSDIRYVGTLHEINSDDSTVSLENVRSYGTEGRKGVPEEEVSASDQLYEYIVFRGTDVKDLRIEEGPAKENKPPPAVPNDPAIVGARPRPANAAPGPLGPPGPPGPPGHLGHAGHPGPGPLGAPNQQGLPQGVPQGPPQGPPPGAPGFGYYPPHMSGWGRAAGPGPNGYGGMQYPPPQWFPPGQEYAPPMGPGPWNNYQYPPGPGGPPGIPGGPGAPGQPTRQPMNPTTNNMNQAPKPSPIGPAAEKKPATPAQQAEIPSEPKSLAQQPKQAPAAPVAPAAAAPPPPVESKPTVEEVKATAASLTTTAPAASSREAPKAVPTGPKNNRPTQILPAVPLPIGLTARAAPQAPSASKPAPERNNTSIHDATQAARAAVAVAMANLSKTGGQPAAPAPVPQQSNGTAMDNLARKVNEMRVNAPRSGAPGPGPAIRAGRARAPRPTKVEVPDSDFDFASSNAKFNKQDVVKEAIAGSPLTETVNGGSTTPELVVADALGSVPAAYNKSSSFFDNISSEAKDRLDNHGQKPGGREWRGEEQRKNMETFGQGSVDGGYRGFRGGRGRGRGGRGRGFRGGRGAPGVAGVPRPQPAAQ